MLQPLEKGGDPHRTQKRLAQYGEGLSKSFVLAEVFVWNLKKKPAKVRLSIFSDGALSGNLTTLETHLSKIRVNCLNVIVVLDFIEQVLHVFHLGFSELNG